MTFVEVANIADVTEGSGKKVEVNGKSIALFKKNGTIHALNEECAHAGGPLSEGVIENDHVVCPWHGFSYDLKTGKSPQNCEVQTYPVKVENNKILIDV